MSVLLVRDARLSVVIGEEHLCRNYLNLALPLLRTNPLSAEKERRQTLFKEQINLPLPPLSRQKRTDTRLGKRMRMSVLLVRDFASSQTVNEVDGRL